MIIAAPQTIPVLQAGLTVRKWLASKMTISAAVINQLICKLISMPEMPPSLNNVRIFTSLPVIYKTLLPVAASRPLFIHLIAASVSFRYIKPFLATIA